MESLLKAVSLGGVPYAKSRRDDDTVDRLNHRMTVAILVTFFFVVVTKQFVGDSILCWHPAHFEGSHEDYANSYCWIRNTYYLPLEDDIPEEHENEKRAVVPYYQWVPMILLVQALLFYSPYVLWTALSGRSGIDIHSIVEAGQSFTSTDMTEIRDKTLMYMTMMMDRYLRCHNLQNDEKFACTISVKRCLSRTCCRTCGRRQGNYLIFLYMLIKLIYIANAVGQLFLLDVFIGPEFHRFGIDFIRGAVSLGRDWPTFTSTRFPRSTMCDFKVRRLGNIHRYTIQCVLPINLFNEKIFLFLYFWLIFISIASLGSLVMWAWRFAYAPGRRRYVKRHLDFVRKLVKDNYRQKVSRRFVQDYLGQDGVFILRMIAHNTNTLTVTEFIESLWENFKKKPIAKKGFEDDDV